MIHRLFLRVFPRLASRSLTLEKALEHVRTVGAYADMLAASPVASTDVPHDAFGASMPRLIEDLSQARMPTGIARIARHPDDIGGTVEVTWTQSVLGMRLSRHSLQIVYGEDNVFAFPLPTTFQPFAHELTEYLSENAGIRTARDTLEVAKALALRLHQAFEEILRKLADERLRTRYDGMLAKAETAVSCVAAAIETERPGSMGSVYANLEKSRFLADVLYPRETDVAELRFPIDVPRHLVDMLPGYAILVASMIRTSRHTVVAFEDNWLESPPVSDDPIELIRLARLHGTDVTYGAVLDAAYADAGSENLL